jgi:CPA2 family monovalent cation:H+ antiporter-2
MRAAFAVMFFLSVGMLFEPRQALQSPLLIAVTLAIVMIGKPLAAMVIVAVLGYSSKIGLGVALALAQVGEFSFLLATLGLQVGALPDSAMNPIIATAVISIMVNPLLYRQVGQLERFIERHRWLWRVLNRKAGKEVDASIDLGEESKAVHRAVIVGYGPIGQMVSRLLWQRGVEPTVIEMDINVYRRLRSEGKAAVYGDVNQREVLEKAGIAGAASLILSASGMAAATEAVRAAREINPDIYVVARADYLRETESLHHAGASEVFSGEGEVALAIADSILQRLGTSSEQVDETREQIRLTLRDTRH